MTKYPESVPQSEELEILFHSLPAGIPPEMVIVILNATIEAFAGWLLPYQLKIEKRNREMMALFDGGNMKQLCRRYGIHRATFYRIYEKEKARIRMIRKREK